MSENYNTVVETRKACLVSRPIVTWYGIDVPSLAPKLRKEDRDRGFTILISLAWICTRVSLAT